MKHILPVAAVFTVAALAFVLRSGSAAAVDHRAPVALDDAQIVWIFDNANTSAIVTGEFAARMGSTKDVRDLSAMLARDHMAVRQQGRDLARKLGVKPRMPRGDSSREISVAAVASLKKLAGAEFDRAFLAHEVAYHDAVTKALLPAIQNAEPKDLVQKVAPAFVAHRDAAKNLSTKS